MKAGGTSRCGVCGVNLWELDLLAAVDHLQHRSKDERKAYNWDDGKGRNVEVKMGSNWTMFDRRATALVLGELALRMRRGGG